MGQTCAKEAFDVMEACCDGSFTDVFSVTRGDCGSDFLGFVKIETGAGGLRCIRMLCRGPMRSNREETCEKSHAELRAIMPKGIGFDAPAFGDAAEIRPHVSSYSRPGGTSQNLYSWFCSRTCLRTFAFAPSRQMT